MKRGTSGLNLLLGIDKPSGMTSHDVVDRVRRALGERRVGHAGTLDPLATGVLVVGVGQGTRLMGFLSAETKGYLARIAFGAETDTLDAEGACVRTAEVPAELADIGYARELVKRFVGPQLQVPPAFSAISVNGRRAYARARAGEAVELEARPITVEAAEVVAIDTVDNKLCWQCVFTVSKGTYVRSLARDIGRAAGTAAYLDALCRTSSGNVLLRQCCTLEQLCEAGAARVGELALDPVRALGMAVMRLDAREARDAASGKALPAPVSLQTGSSVVLVDRNAICGVWRVEGSLLRPQANFPSGITGVRA